MISGKVCFVMIISFLFVAIVTSDGFYDFIRYLVHLALN